MKFDDDPDKAKIHATNPSRPENPLWEKEWKFEVEANNSETNSDIITEAGSFYIEVENERGETGSGEAGLYSAGKNGKDVGGGQIIVTLNDSDGKPPISVGQSTAD